MDLDLDYKSKLIVKWRVLSMFSAHFDVIAESLLDVVHEKSETDRSMILPECLFYFHLYNLIFTPDGAISSDS